ncbi:MAG: sarcosine oxidase subunit gamma, partial [Geminicoccaceae bacterium]
LEAVRDALAGRAALIDLGHGQTVLRLEGEAARKVLAKLCRVDLHPKVFAPGCVARTPLGPVAVLIHCVEADAFDLYVPRSLARSAALMLIDAGGEFGLEVAASIV